jgi:hypothetical protein
MYNDYFNSDLLLEDYEKEKRQLQKSESIYVKKLTDFSRTLSKDRLLGIIQDKKLIRGMSKNTLQSKSG